MTTTQTSYFRTRIAEAIAISMVKGATYEQATSEAFGYCNRRWPNLLAATLAA